MKKNSIFFALLTTLIIFLFSCSENEDDLDTSKGSVNFQIKIDENLKSTANSEPERSPKAIFISVKNSNNEYVFNLLRLPLIKIGNEYVTEQVELDVDFYTLEDFIVVDNEDSAIYLTPKIGSKFELLVDNPLPMEFEIASNVSSPVVAEVIPSNLGDPLEFGYATFSFVVVNTLERGLAAYYPFNGNAKDVSGFGNDGLVNGAILTTDRNDKSNSAYCFNGNEDIQIPTSSFFNNMDQFCICVWVYPTELKYRDNTIISKVYLNRDFNIKILKTNMKYEAHFVTHSPLTYYRCYSNNEIKLNTWTHITYQWTGNKWQLYVNGIFENETDHSGSAPLWTGKKMAIGSMNDSEYFTGKIDEVRIYNRNLSDREIYSIAKL